ncbi:MAG: HNH endonuclease, partial [Dysgonomonas sp.]
MENTIFNQMMDNLSDNYTPLVCYHLNNDNKTHLGEKKDKTCRFCGNKHPEVTFKMVTHAIPEFTGNKTLISEYECDICNGLFSQMETQMSNYM